MACPYEKDVYNCARHLVDSGYSAKDAIGRAMGSWGKNYIRTTTPSNVDERLGAWVDKHSKLNEELKAKGEPPLFRCVVSCCCFGISCLGVLVQKQAPHHVYIAPTLKTNLSSLPIPMLSSSANRKRHGAKAGTLEAIANVRKCAKKGCLSSGLPIEKEYSVDSVTARGLKRYHKRIGTAKNENLHRCVRFGYSSAR